MTGEVAVEPVRYELEVPTFEGAFYAVDEEAAGAFVARSDWSDIKNFGWHLIGDWIVTGESGGRVDVGPGLLRVRAEREFDPVPVVVELRDGSPDAPLAAWDEVVACSIEIESGVLTLGGQNTDLSETRRVAVPPGTYEVVVCAGGLRAPGATEGAPPADHYRIALWPGEARTPVVLKALPKAESAPVTLDPAALRAMTIPGVVIVGGGPLLLAAGAAAPRWWGFAGGVLAGLLLAGGLYLAWPRRWQAAAGWHGPPESVAAWRDPAAPRWWLGEWFDPRWCALQGCVTVALFAVMVVICGLLDRTAGAGLATGLGWVGGLCLGLAVLWRWLLGRADRRPPAGRGDR